MAKTLIGLDLGNAEMKFAIIRGKTARFVTSVLPENMVVGGRVQMPGTMKTFIKSEIKRLKVPAGDCALVLPDGQVFCRRISMPYMPESQLILNLPYEFRDYIAQNNDKYFYDYAVEKIVNDEEGKPASIDLMAAAVAQTVISDYTEMLSGTGLKFKAAIPREMSYIYILRGYEAANPADNREYCLADIGRESTRVHFFVGTRLAASRNIDLGCRDIDMAIADEKNVDEYVAASYKLTNYQDVMNMSATREVYNRIAIEVMKAVNFYRFSNSANGLNDIYFLGGGAKIPTLCKEIVENTKLEFHYFTELLPVDTSDEAAIQAAVAFGAAAPSGGAAV